MEIASLKDNLEEEHELRISLEEQLESMVGEHPKPSWTWTQYKTDLL